MTFEKKEIVSATALVRQFSSFLTFLTTQKLRKIAIIRNNEMEAVVLPIKEYERLLEIEEKAKKKSVKDYFGIMSQEDFQLMEKAVKECRKVDINEW
ncbi:MAG: hypothetical protein MJ185_08785 [Treponema sp.]|nr:hypothetical protein [Treponema sp.]